MKKPVRRVRRRVRRYFHRKGKGKRSKRRLRGKGVVSYLAQLPDDDLEEILFGKGQRGKGKGRHARRTTGKGKGRRGNPFGPNGQPLKCHGCESTDHLVRDCPNKGNGERR